MFHARYYEPPAQMFRALLRNHYAECAECGARVCGKAQTLDGPYRPCTLGGEACDGTRVDDRILCGMCY